MSNKISKAEIDRFHDYGVYLPTRTLYVGSEATEADGSESGVDHRLASRVIANLHMLNAISGAPITIMLNSIGGDWQHGMAIYDAIKLSKSPITIQVYGQAMSMGAVILQAAAQRLVAPNAKLMIHYGVASSSETHSRIYENWADASKKDRDIMLDIFYTKILEKHPDYKRKKVDHLCNFDTILSAKEAVELGLADGVLSNA